MRTLVLTPDFPPAKGGIQLLVSRLVENATGLEPVVVTSGGTGSGEPDGLDHLDVRRARTLPGPRPLSNAALNARALAEGRRMRPEAIVSAHIVTSPSAALLGHRFGCPVLQYFHAKEIGVHPRLARFAASQANASIAVSSYTRDLLRQLGAETNRVHCLPPGVDIPRGTPSPRSVRPTVVTVARLEDRYKGHDVLLRSMVRVRQRFPDVRWVVVGDGPLRAELERNARACGLGRDTVSFIGAVSDSERDAWLDRADVFAMPSRLPDTGAGEGFGIAYLEAAAHGLPVVAGNVGGALDAVVDGETGLLVDPNDEGAVADALVRLLADRALASRMGIAGAQRATRFVWPAIAERVEALIEELIPRSRRVSVDDRS